MALIFSIEAKLLLAVATDLRAGWLELAYLSRWS